MVFLHPGSPVVLRKMLQEDVAREPSLEQALEPW